MSKMTLSSIVLAILVSFYVLTLGSTLTPTIHPFIDRVTYSTTFIHTYFVNGYYDSVIILFATSFWLIISIRSKMKYLLALPYLAGFILEPLILLNNYTQVITLLSVPMIVLTMICDKFTNHALVKHNLKLTLIYISIITIFFSLIGIIISLLGLSNPSINLPPVNYFYYYYLLFSSFSPILLLVISFYIPLKFLIKLSFKRKLMSNADTKNNGVISEKHHFKTRHRIVVLAVLILVSLLFTAIPHIHSKNSLIGDDSGDYNRFLSNLLESSDIKEVLWQAFIIQSSGDRGLSLIIFYGIVNILNFPTILQSIEFFPFFLGPPLVLTIYYLTARITSNEKIAILASFLTITSFHFTIGLYGGLYANWLALIFGYLTIVFLIKIINTPSKSNLVIFGSTFTAMLLCHAPTWAIFLTVVVIYLALLSIFTRCMSRRTLAYLLLMLLPSIIIDGLRIMFLKSSGILQDIVFAQSQGAGVQNLNAIWDNLYSSSHVYLAGQIGNPIVLVLLLYWLHSYKLTQKYYTWLVIFLSFLIPILLIGVQDIQTRFLYEIPIQIPVAIAVAGIRKKYGSLPAIAIVLSLTVVTIRTLSNLDFSENNLLQ